MTLLRDLVRINNSNPPGNEAQVAEFLAPRLRALGFEVDIIQTPTPGKAHLVARLRAASPTERPILLAGHEDTVGVEPELWTLRPVRRRRQRRVSVRPRRARLQGRPGGVHRRGHAARPLRGAAEARRDPARRGRRGGRQLRHPLARRQPLGQDRRRRVAQRGRLDLQGRPRPPAPARHHHDRQELAVGDREHARDLDPQLAAAARQRDPPARARAAPDRALRDDAAHHSDRAPLPARVGEGVRRQPPAKAGEHAQCDRALRARQPAQGGPLRRAVQRPRARHLRPDHRRQRLPLQRAARAPRRRP